MDIGFHFSMPNLAIQLMSSRGGVGFPAGSVVKNPPANAGDMGSILGSGDPLKKEMATHSNIFAWEITWTEEPDEL